MLQEIDEIFVCFVLEWVLRRVREDAARVPVARPARHLRIIHGLRHRPPDDILFIFLRFLQFAHLLLQLFDDFLAKMRPLCQFLLHLFVNLYVPLQGFDLLLHLVVFEEQLLRLLALVLELRGELMVLQNRQPRRGLQLLVIEGKQIRLGLLDLEQHLLPQLLGGLDLLSFLLSEFKLLLLDLLVQGLFELDELLVVLGSLLLVVGQLADSALQLPDPPLIVFLLLIEFVLERDLHGVQLFLALLYQFLHLLRFLLQLLYLLLILVLVLPVVVYRCSVYLLLGRRVVANPIVVLAQSVVFLLTASKNQSDIKLHNGK